MSEVRRPTILTGSHTSASLKSKIESNDWAAQVFADIQDTVLWVTLTDIQNYDVTIAKVMDIALISSHRGQGIGTQMMEHIAKTSVERGAHVLHSETGIENAAT